MFCHAPRQGPSVSLLQKAVALRAPCHHRKHQTQEQTARNLPPSRSPLLSFLHAGIFSRRLFSDKVHWHNMGTVFSPRPPILEREREHYLRFKANIDRLVSDSSHPSLLTAKRVLLSFAVWQKACLHSLARPATRKRRKKKKTTLRRGRKRSRNERERRRAESSVVSGILADGDADMTFSSVLAARISLFFQPSVKKKPTRK